MSLTLGNIAFQALSLTVLGAFCWMIYTYRTQAAECLKGLVNFSQGEGAENKRLCDKFSGVAMALGALSVGLAAVKAAAWMLTAGTGTPGTFQWKLAGTAGTAGIAGMPSWMAAAMALGVALVAACVVLAEVGIVKAAGGITLSSKFADTIVQTKRNTLAALSLFATPLVAVWSGANPVRDEITMYVFVVLAIAIALLFIVHTLQGFIKQKVSLLVWFLYLCTVEFFPVCAVVLAAIKNI